MRPEDVPGRYVELGLLAFVDLCLHGGGECDCPTDVQVRRILAAVAPEIQAQALEDAAGVMFFGGRGKGPLLTEEPT